MAYMDIYDTFEDWVKYEWFGYDDDTDFSLGDLDSLFDEEYSEIENAYNAYKERCATIKKAYRKQTRKALHALYGGKI